MQLPYELRLGWRYTRAGRSSRRNGFISFISGVSMLGIALGVAALIIVLSVMNGFQTEVRDRMLGVLAHVEVFAPGEQAIPHLDLTLSQVRAHPEVIGAAPFIAAQGLLAWGDTMRGAQIRGIDPVLEPEVTELAAEQQALAQLQPGAFGVVLGAALARNLGVGLGDAVTLIVPSGQLTPAGVMPRMRQLTVSGLFDSGHHEFDSTLAYLHYQDAARLFRLEGPTGVRLKIRDLHQAPEVALQLAATLSGDLFIRDWTRVNRTWFAAVQLEKRMMFIILTLIVAVAAFNLVSTLVMTVTDKRADIAILRTLGASPGSIMATFMVQGALAGLIGTALGLLLGLGVAFNVDTLMAGLERLLGFTLLPPEILPHHHLAQRPA